MSESMNLHMSLPGALAALLERRDLDSTDMAAVMRQIMTGAATPAQIGAFLAALRMKGETVDEVAAAAGVMRELATKVELGVGDTLDIVGTGGDATGTFNISTCCALVAAAAGARVAKHGNRSVSSKSGAADLLETAGVNIDLAPEQVAQCIETLGVGFMFAPRHHGAMKHAIGPRREMGVRTIFNLLGPLTNPAGARDQLLGVYAARWVRPLAEVLGKLGSRNVMVVHGHGGLDEISLSGVTQVAQWQDGQVRDYSIDPREHGFDYQPLEAIRVQGPTESLAMIGSVLANQPGPALDIVLLNSAAALQVAGVAGSLDDGLARARVVLENGTAAARLQQLVTLSQELSHAGE